MKVFKKQWFAIIVLILAVGASVVIGYTRHENRRNSNDRVFRDANLDTSLTLSFASVADKEKMLAEDTREKIQIYNANWETNYSSVVWFGTWGKPDGDVEKFAESEFNKAGLSKKDALFVLFEDNKDFVFFAGEEFPFSFDKQRAADIISIVETAYDSDLDTGILRAYNKLNEFYASEDVVFEEKESEGGVFDSFFNDPSYDTFKESIDNVVSTYTDSEKNQKIRCFTMKTEHKIESASSESSERNVSEDEGDKGGIPYRKWKTVVIVMIVLVFVFSRKKTSYK
ncbi:MAG: TPM domain-containing protein [Lachnospiraceae bacterium]|nr:TPM domain-containing protein [Lachnospiraceae bacterium]